MLKINARFSIFWLFKNWGNFSDDETGRFIKTKTKDTMWKTVEDVGLLKSFT